MAIGIENYPNIDTSNPSAYPKGRLSDDPLGVSGTPVNVQTNGDIHQTFMKLLLDAGLTANNTPDNATTVYQYMTALRIITGSDTWYPAGTPNIFATSGTITITAPNIIYNKFSINGYTMRWQIQLRNVSISGSPTQLVLSLPATIRYPFLSGTSFVNQNMTFLNIYNGAPTLLAKTGTSIINLTTTTGGFTNGTANQDFDIDLQFEIQP